MLIDDNPFRSNPLYQKCHRRSNLRPRISSSGVIGLYIYSVPELFKNLSRYADISLTLLPGGTHKQVYFYQHDLSNI